MGIEIFPSIDLRGGRVVRLLQGDYGRQTTYDVAPAEVLAAYAAAGARWVHIVDLDGAKAGTPVQAALVAEMLAGTASLAQVGGGVRTTDDIRRLLAAGAARVVVGTAALEDWAWFRETVHAAEFAGRLTLALDARDGVVATRGWTASSGRLAVELAAEVAGWPLAGLLYTDVAVDGTLAGPNVAATARLAAATDVPVIASGGVGELSHIVALRDSGAVAVVVGRALYEGKVDLAAAITAGR